MHMYVSCAFPNHFYCQISQNSMIEWFCVLLQVLLACEKLFGILIYGSNLIEMKILNVYGSRKDNTFATHFWKQWSVDNEWQIFELVHGWPKWVCCCLCEQERGFKKTCVKSFPSTLSRSFDESDFIDLNIWGIRSDELFILGTAEFWLLLHPIKVNYMHVDNMNYSIARV